MAKLNLKLFKEEADSLRSKLENDPYLSGAKLKSVYPDEVSDMLDFLFWLKGTTEISLTITKSPDDLLDIKITNRK